MEEVFYTKSKNEMTREELLAYIDFLTEQTNVWYLLYREQCSEKKLNEVNDDFEKRRIKLRKEIKEADEYIAKYGSNGYYSD